MDVLAVLGVIIAVIVLALVALLSISLLILLLPIILALPIIAYLAYTGHERLALDVFVAALILWLLLLDTNRWPPS